MVNLLISTTALYPESGLRRVLDPKTGIIKTLGRLFRNPGEPTPHVVMSNITAFQRFSGNKADFAATGMSLSQERAYWSAVGESVERYCAALSDFHELVFGSYDDLAGSGDEPLHPDTFTLFQEQQYTQTDFPFSRPTPRHCLSWARGERLESREPVLVPAGLVFNQFRPEKDEIRLCPDIHPGVASGFSREQAIRNALLEIIERDTMMIHWLNLLPVTGIEADDAFRELIRDCGIPPHLSLHLVYLQNDFAVPCIFALLLDRANGPLGGGCSAGFSAQWAARKAVCEAIQILRLSREVQRGKEGKLAFKAGAILPAFLDPAARKKLPMTQLLFNLGYYLDTSNWNILRPLISPRRTISLLDCEQSAPSNEYGSLISRFVAAGLSPICVELTTPDVADVGWLVFRIVAPGAVPNLATLYPPLAAVRLATVPGKLGFSPRRELNLNPMPYA